METTTREFDNLIHHQGRSLSSEVPLRNQAIHQMLPLPPVWTSCRRSSPAAAAGVSLKLKSQVLLPIAPEPFHRDARRLRTRALFSLMAIVVLFLLLRIADLLLNS